MNISYKKITSLFLAILMLGSVSTSYADLVSPKKDNAIPVIPKTNLQKTATIKIADITKLDSSGKTTTAIMKIAEKYYKFAEPKIEKELKADFKKKVKVTPTFNVKKMNPKNATRLSNVSAVSLLSNNTLYYSMAIGAAAFSDNAKSNLVSNNLAESIYHLQTYKDVNKDKLVAKEKLKIVDDVITIYKYAISLNPKNPDTLVNLGNIFIDLDRQEDAKILFKAALKISPNNYRAKEGMAAYYLARGDLANAKKQLNSDIVLSGTRKKEVDKLKVLSDKKLAPEITIMDSAETAKDAIEKLSKLPVLSTADFIQEIDPIDAQQIRNKVNKLPEKDKLRLPKLTGLAGITTYKAYSDSEYAVYLEQATYSFLSKWDREIESAMGLNNDLDDFDFNFDDFNLDDEDDDYDPDNDVELGEYLKSIGGGSNALANVNESQGTVANYDDSVAAYIQKYNKELLGKKQMAYMTYLDKKMKEYKQIITVTQENYSKKLEASDKELAAQLSNARNQKEAEAINNTFWVKQDEIRENCFHANFNYVVHQYTNVIKPMIERYWAETMPNVRMISDPDLKRVQYGLVAMTAKSAYEEMFEIIHDSPYADGGNAIRTGVVWTAEDEEYERKMKEKAENEYKGVNTPGKPSIEFPIEFSVSQSIGIAEIKITPTSIEISFAFLVAGKVNYDFVNSTAEVGLGVGVKFQAVDTNTMITLKVDTNTGNVKEIDWKASASAGIEVAGIKIGGTYEASVMNGNKFTPTIGGSY